MFLPRPLTNPLPSATVSNPGVKESQTITHAADTALINGRLILPTSIVHDKAVVVRGGHIAAIVDASAAHEIGQGDLPVLDVQGRYIAPGFIDIHTHGALGYTFNDSSTPAFSAITKVNAKYGVTSLLATIATAPIPDLVECMAFARDWIAQPHDGTTVLGVHLEGPYFSVAQKGAQDERYIRNPDDGTADALLAYADVMKIMSFAPELPGALALTERLCRLGIVPAAGHSSARDEHVQAAMDSGLRHIIHIWSGQSTTVRDGPWRKPGLLEASLTFPDLTVEMIADNKHLPATLMALAYKCIGSERLCIISDATSGAGLPDGSLFTMGKMEYVVQDGVGMTLDGTSFAGSTTLQGQMIPILVNVLGLSIPEAVRMASLTPARVIGVEARKGSLVAGKDADLVILDDSFAVWRTMINGTWSYIA